MTHSNDGLTLIGWFIALALILTGTSYAQMATEIMPGVTFYSGPNGGTMGVEIMPGYRQYSGEIQGHSVEIMPGVRSYDIRPSDPYPQPRETYGALPYAERPDQRTGRAVMPWDRPSPGERR